MKKMSWQRILAFIVFAAIGIALIVFGAINTKSPIANYKEVTAVVSNVVVSSVKDNNGMLTEKKNVYVDYEVDGVEYTQKQYNKDGDFKKGDSIKILYNPDNPEQIATGSEQPYGGFIIALGVVFIAGGCFLLFNGMQSKKTTKKKAKKK